MNVQQEFPIYSIAKSFLAQAILELGIPIESKVGLHLEGLAPVYAECKIETLLNHTAGLSDYGQLAEYHDAVSKEEKAWSRQALFEKTLQLSNDHKGFRYSNMGYLLLRMVLEQKTGLSLFESIRELVLNPLRIDGFKEWENTSDLVARYDPMWVYSGTFVATESALLDGYLKLIRHRSETIGLKKGITSVPYPNTGFENPNYGFGIMCDWRNEKQEPLFVGHGGGGPGFSQMILVNTETWKIALETSSTDLDQAKAILRLREKTSR